jgi:hypothetical protein
MLKDEAFAKKGASKGEENIELSSSPFEQKFADLRPTGSPVLRSSPKVRFSFL